LIHAKIILISRDGVPTSKEIPSNVFVLVYEVLQYAIKNIEEEEAMNIERMALNRCLYAISNLFKEFSEHAIAESEVETFKTICKGMEHMCDSMKDPIETGK
jgi:hypothetical protein